MNALSLNCQGLGNPWTVHGLCQLVKEKRPSLVFLMETKLSASKFERVRVAAGFQSAFVVDSVGRSGFGTFVECRYMYGDSELQPSTYKCYNKN
jgi:exonuclease III